VVKAMVLAVERRWHEPDHGIWEFRGTRKHHVYSKVMCWLSVNRALVVEDHVTGRVNQDWVALRDAIAADVIEKGWNEQVGAFTGAYGETWLDAATLHVGLSGLLPAEDARFIRTVEAVARELRCGPTVYRYRHDDGLPGMEGGFHLCTSWLIHAFVLLGRRSEARELLEGFAALAGPTGTLSEEYDPSLRLSLGNLPQAYSHLALINAAVLLDD
jgi:trehalose 6-phosphate phosphatase